MPSDLSQSPGRIPQVALHSLRVFFDNDEPAAAPKCGPYLFSIAVLSPLGQRGTRNLVFHRVAKLAAWVPSPGGSFIFSQADLTLRVVLNFRSGLRKGIRRSTDEG